MVDVPKIDATEFPRYRCHKLVRAVQITSITPIAASNTLPSPTLGQGPFPHRVTWENFGGTIGGAFDAPADMFARGVPKVGDYLVVYEDGYISFSPKAAFEEGYHLDYEPHGDVMVKAGSAGPSPAPGDA